MATLPRQAVLPERYARKATQMRTPAEDEPTAPALSQMTRVFCLVDTAPVKLCTRKKMSDAEKAAYRKRRMLGACDRCIRRKCKCTHDGSDCRESSDVHRATVETSNADNSIRDDYQMSPEAYAASTPPKTASADRITDSDQPRRSVDALPRIAAASPRAVSPVLGAMCMETFPLGGIPMSLELLQYMTQVVLPKLYYNNLRSNVQNWVYLFCQHPIVYHVTSYAIALHRDIWSGSTNLSEKTVALTAKGKALGLLKDGLLDAEHDDIEILLAAMLILGCSCTERVSWGTPPSFALTPFFPSANWHNVFGRLKFVELHRNAMLQLVNRLGGLANMKFANIAVLIAHADLRAASETCTRPVLTSYWQVPSAIVSSHHELHTSFGHRPGRGFLISSNADFPVESVSIFMKLATLNCFMATIAQKTLTGREYEEMIVTRNALHHAAISLPPTELAYESNKATTGMVSYEICRIAVTIYSTAVLFALPPDCGWHLGLVRRLQDLLNEVRPDLDIDLLIWVLCIGGLASTSLRDCAFFTDRLSRLASRKNITFWTDVELILDGYLWSKTACGNGASLLWAST